MKTARFRLDADLRGLLLHSRDSSEFDLPFSGPQSAKHLIESLGLPHTEVGSVRANAQAVDLGYLVRDGDTLEFFGRGADAVWPDEPRFVIDGHLGRLNSHLRMLGFDCVYQSRYADNLLLAISLGEARLLLTRDRRLLMHKELSLGYLPRSVNSEQQLQEVVRRYSLLPWIKPFRRCIRCDHLLLPVRKEDVLDRLEPLTRLYFEEFRICPACRQVYWKGSHFERMQRLITGLQA